MKQIQTRLVDRSSILAELKHGAYFTLKKKDYASILCRLKDGNAVLNTLANQNSELEPTRRSRSQAKLARLIRKVSQGIYSAFQNVMACKCSHNLGLEMAPRNDVMLPGDEDDEAARSLDFSLIIGSSSYGQEHSNSTQRWERVRVQMAGNEIELPTPPTTPSPGIQRSKSPRRVRWTSSLTMMRTVQTTTSVTQTTTHLHNASSLSASIHLSSGPQPSAITNLCHMLKTGKGKATVPDCYGHISNKSSKFNLYPELEDCQPENLSTISLRAILEGQAGDDGLGQFTYTERLKVALALSYSILHLYNTPWLARIVTSDDIVFLREQQAPSCHIYYLDRPFLSKSLSASGNPTSGYQQHPTQTMFRPVDLTILSLGLLLTQIIIGRHVKDLAAVPDMGMDSIIEKQKIASNMAGSVLQNGGMNYAGAVQWCLSSILSVACLDDEKFGQEFHGAVIARLENDLRLQSSMTSTT